MYTWDGLSTFIDTLCGFTNSSGINYRLSIKIIMQYARLHFVLTLDHRLLLCILMKMPIESRRGQNMGKSDMTLLIPNIRKEGTL